MQPRQTEQRIARKDERMRERKGEEIVGKEAEKEGKRKRKRCEWRCREGDGQLEKLRIENGNKMKEIDIMR